MKDDAHVLWVQEQHVRRTLSLHKSLGAANPADLVTRSLTKQDIDKHIHKLNIFYKAGRSGMAPKLHSFRISSVLVPADVSRRKNNVNKAERDKWQVQAYVS